MVQESTAAFVVSRGRAKLGGEELKKEFAVDEPDWADSSIKHCLRRERSLDHRVLCSIRLLLIRRHCCLYFDNVQCLCDQDGLCYCESGPHIGFYYITLDCALLMFCWLTPGQFLWDFLFFVDMRVGS